MELYRDDTARATMCPAQNFPTIAINLTASNHTGGRVNSSIFHEILHLAGYPHDEGVDLPYLATTCCISYEKNQKAQACSMIREPGLNWMSNDYQRRWVEYMVGRNQYALGAQTGYYAALRSGSGVPMMENGLSLIARSPGATPAAKRESGLPFLGMVMGYAAYPVMAASEYKDRQLADFNTSTERYYPQSGSGARSLARSIGTLLTATLQNDSAAVTTSALAVRLSLTAYCSSLSVAEKRSVIQALSVAADQYRRFDVGGLKWEDGCG
jgi:hypothetical protein